jgi:hypothetical protein
MIFSGDCHYKPASNIIATTQLNKSKCISQDVPKDLRLGTKIRVISELPFPWMQKMSSGIFKFNYLIDSLILI